MRDTTEGHDHPPEQDAESDRAPGLADDDLYRALAATERRRVLYVLQESGEQTVGQLATLLAGWEASTSGRMRDSRDHDRIAIELVHVHLPMLADLGLLTFHQEADRVRPVEIGAAVADLLEQSIDAEQ